MKSINYFHEGVLPVEWNFTQLVLLPKILNPTAMADLRPTSLCYVTYKIISKVLCSRLKESLPHIVSLIHSAFVAGRLISDNLLITHEIMPGLKTNSSSREDYITIKLTCPKPMTE